MAGYLKLKAKVNKAGNVEADFWTRGLSNEEILSVVSWLHYSVIESVAKSSGLNAEETNNKIGELVIQSRDALLQLYLLSTQKERKEHEKTRL